MDMERRFFEAERVEIRKGKPGAASTIGGYAARFGVLSENLGGFREKIAPGAFAACLGDDIRALFNHDTNIVLGRTTAGTCRVMQDSKGLQYEIDLPDTQAARDLLIAIDRGDVTQSSFGFRVAPNGDTWDEDESGVIVRTVTKVARLYDVSPVTIPAYPDASVGKRSLDVWQEARKAEMEKAQKEAIHRRHLERARWLRMNA